MKMKNNYCPYCGVKKGNVGEVLEAKTPRPEIEIPVSVHKWEDVPLGE